MLRGSESSGRRNADYFLNRSAGFLAGGKTKQATKTLKDGLKDHPYDVRLSLRLGALEMGQKNYNRAIYVLREALTAAPQHPDLLYHLGVAFLFSGDGKNAQTYLEQAMLLHPNDIPVQEALGASLLTQHKPVEALAVFDRALKITTDGARKIKLGLDSIGILQDLSRMDDAFRLIQELKRIDSNHTGVLLAEAKLHSDLGDVEKTEACLMQVLEREPDNIDAFVILNRITLRDLDPDVLGRTEAFLADERIDDTARAKLNFLAGETLDRMGDHDRAFGHFESANNAQRNVNGPFDIKAHRTFVERTKSVFDRETLSRASELGAPSERPIFIVGMPRSGTSLAEQILASHPAVHGVGEREEITEIAGSLSARLGAKTPYPDCVRALTREIAGELAEVYLDRVSLDVPPDLRLTDKMPRNFLDLGLIRLLFPNACIIHCVRDPIDTCLSCFVSNFGNRQIFSNRISDLAAYYNSYRDLMEHWNVALDPPIFELRYEDLVADPETEIPRLIEYCRLPWDDKCLAPHLASRRVTTASRWQVRRPIYSSSVSRSAKYGARLDELRAMLAI